MHGLTRIPSRSGYTPNGSGAEDIGARIQEAHDLAPYEARAREVNDSHRQAEETARNRRLDRDRLIAAGLYALELQAFRDWPTESGRLHDIGYRAAIPTYTLGYIRELLTEIRAELSPLVRDRQTEV